MNNIILSSQENGIAELTENLEQDPGIIKTYLEGLVPSLLGFLLQVLLAIVILLIGSRLIKWLVKLIRKSLMRSRAETGVTTFLCSLLKYVMYFILIMVVLSQFGVTTSSVVAGRTDVRPCASGQSVKFCGRRFDPSFETLCGGRLHFGQRNQTGGNRM